MSARSERKAAAEARRREWRLRWLELAKNKSKEGLGFADCILAVGDDADQLVAKDPQLRSELILAIKEFTVIIKMAIVIHKAKEGTTP